MIVVSGRSGGDRVPALWLVDRSPLVGESERVRLALCPGIRKLVDRYERLSMADMTETMAAVQK